MTGQVLDTPRTADHPQNPQNPEEVPGEPGGRWTAAVPRGYRTARLGLLAGQLALLGWIASRSWFFADDLLYGSLLGSAPLDRQLLLRSWFGHLVPGYIAVDWTFYHVVGLNWPVAVVIMVAVTLGAAVALLRLLEALCGRRWPVLAVTALFAFSLMLTTQVLWWGAVMTNIVPLGASIATLGCFVRWHRSGRLRHLVGMAVCFLVAVAFYEKSVLTAAYVALLSVLVLDAGRSWGERVRAAVRRWPAWVILGAIAVADLGWYLTHDYLVEAGPAPATRSLAAFLFYSFTEGFAPSILGVHQPVVALLGSATLTLVVANVLLLGIALVTSLRSRRALQAWLFFAGAYLVNQAVLGRGRVGLLGPHIGTLLRYQIENTFLFCIALAVALPALRGAWPRRFVPRARGRSLSAWAVVVVLALLLLPYWVASLREEIRVAPGNAARSWFAELRSSYDQEHRLHPALGFVDGVVPPWLVYAQMAPYNQYDHVLPQALPGARLDRSADHGLAISDTGRAYPVVFSPAADLPGGNVCLSPGEHAGVVLRPTGTLPDQQWFVSVRYRGAAPSGLRIALANGVQGPDQRWAMADYQTGSGSGRLVVSPGSVPVAAVSLQVTGPADVCLQDVELGAMRPER